MVLLDQELNRSSVNRDKTPGAESKNSAPNNQEQQRQQDQQMPESQNVNTNREENPEVLLKMLIQAAQKLWMQIKRASQFVMVDLGGYQLFDRLAHWCVQHPQMAICLLAAGLVGILPFLLFIAFALSTIVMTFTGFLVLEGTLLTILTMMMFGLLGALAIMLLFFAIVGVATYFGVAHVYDMFGSTEVERTTLRNFLQRENPQRSTETPLENTNHTGHTREENVR